MGSSDAPCDSAQMAEASNGRLPSLPRFHAILGPEAASGVRLLPYSLPGRLPSRTNRERRIGRCHPTALPGCLGTARNVRATASRSSRGAKGAY